MTRSIETERYTITVGTTPGYFHNNERAPNEHFDLSDIIAKANELCEKIKAESGVFPTFIATVGKAVYPKKFGCPDGGEFVVVLSGERNPVFEDHPQKNEVAWITLARALQETFRQTTIRLVIEPVRLYYFSKK